MARYREYPMELKHEVAKSGQTNLFPNLKIPRTTAAYCVKKRRSLAEEIKSKFLHAQRIAELELAVKREKALRMMVEDIRKVFPYKFTEKIVKKPEDRKSLARFKNALR